jgi:hypothetical protein
MSQITLKDIKKYSTWLDLEKSGRLKASFKCLRDSAFGFWVKVCVRAVDVKSSENVDVLIVHPSESSRRLGRKNFFLQKIKSSGIVVAEEVLIKASGVNSNCFSEPDKDTPLRFYALAGYAKYLIKKYRPRIVINERYSPVFSFYIKEYLPEDGRLVHLAHSIPSNDTNKFCLNYFDYYFLFGQSSIDKMAGKSVRFGSSKACAVGSYLIQDDFYLGPSQPNKNVLIIAMGDWPKYNDAIENYYEMFLAWIKRRDDLTFFVKLHPKSETGFWGREAQGYKNVNVLPQSCSIKEAVSKACVVVNMHSNACIESAVLNRPIIPADPLPFLDEFEVEKYFFKNCQNTEALDSAYNQIVTDYPHFVEQARRFAERHVANGAGSVPCMVSTIKSILQGKEDFPFKTLDHKPPYLF